MTHFRKQEAGNAALRPRQVAFDHEDLSHFRMPNASGSEDAGVCRHLADALDRCSGSTLQQRWNDFEKRFWPKWKAGIDRRGSAYWTWGARVLISARMIVPSLDMSVRRAREPVDRALAGRSPTRTAAQFAAGTIGRSPGLQPSTVIWQFATDCGFSSYVVTTVSTI